jgi:hypothetical protein
MMRKFAMFAILLIGLAAPAMAQQQPIRVNCGGASYTDTKGHLWKSDYGFNAGTEALSSVKVSGTTDPMLYESQRWNSSTTAPLIYSFPVVDGLYQANLYFAETVLAEQRVGARVFNVKLQGVQVFHDLDIFAAAGANKALVKSSNVEVQNGKITIEFDNVVQHAEIQAIEILPLPAGHKLTLNFKYPDGTPVTGDLNYTITSSLINFQGKEPLTNGQAQAVLLASPNALGISFQFQVKLSLVDTAGHTLWGITLALNPTQVNLAEVVDSALNVTVKKM